MYTLEHVAPKKRSLQKVNEADEIFERAVRETRGQQNAVRRPVFESFAETLLPQRHLAKFKERFPNCLDIGRWANGEGDTVWLLVAFNYRSPNRCIKRQSIIRVAYATKSGGAIKLFGKETGTFSFPDNPGEITMQLLHILDHLMPH